MTVSKIKCLEDLNGLRSAPVLNKYESASLSRELVSRMDEADWFTIGIMAPSSKVAMLALRQMESIFNWSAMQVVNQPKEEGPVFLKANQKTGDIHIRIEYGLGEGILLSCQHNEEQKNADTIGPLPLEFF